MVCKKIKNSHGRRGFHHDRRLQRDYLPPLQALCNVHTAVATKFAARPRLCHVLSRYAILMLA